MYGEGFGTVNQLHVRRWTRSREWARIAAVIFALVVADDCWASGIRVLTVHCSEIVVCLAPRKRTLTDAVPLHVVHHRHL